MSWRSIKWLLAAVPIPWAFSDEFYTIRMRHAGRVQTDEGHPSLNPNYPQVTSWVEDDYVLIRRVGDSVKYQDLKGKWVLVRDPEDRRRTVMRRLQAVEGEWVMKSQFFRLQVPAGHGYMGEDDSAKSVPLALIEGVAEKVIWPPGRRMDLPAEISP